jgi:predicted transglutaminase-like cysteine proteinase
MPDTGIFKTIKTYLERNRIGELLVLRKSLSPQQLKAALARQQCDSRSLGQILVQEGYVTRSQVRVAIATQYTLRCIATALTLMVSISAFAPRTASAESMKDIPVQMTLASASLGNMHAYPQLFGTGEKKSADLSAFTKWSTMFDRFEQDSQSENGKNVLATWRADLESMRGLPLETMVARVNDMANRVKYITDNKNWGRSDYWETPVEFFTRGGDCEDFAITKYVSLRALGVPDDRMRVAIVKDMEKNIPHAILIVYGDTGTYVLDNQIKSVRATNNINHYKPIFSINRSAWWLHTSPSATIVASAAGQ